VQATPSPDLRAQILADVNAGVCLNVTGWTERLHITSRQWYPLIMPLRRDKLIYHSQTASRGSRGHQSGRAA
jgi:hypothetical protein